ncbi:MAG: T9SS type A sorting domain-containing protein [Ignavibacteria bacterium]|nr:T9SS type A sorting domain-containing protein [Ignavibacteria bacterium]
MKTFFLLFLFLFTLSLPNEVYSIDTTSSHYFPLKTGNVYVYQRSDNNAKYKATIVKDSVFNNHKYYYCSNFPFPGNGWFRVDSTTGSLMKFVSANPCQQYLSERLIDSLAARTIGFASNSCNVGILLNDTNNVTVFGLSRRSKSFGMPGYHETFIERYVYDIGISTYTYCFYQPYGCYTYNLTGAVMNSLVYGDTSGASALVGIVNINNVIPKEYFLSQNFPNPFNPQTKIKFSIPLLRGVTAEGGRGVFVSLIIYDLLGREVATLVNEQLKPGTYEADWDASNFSSGVYFYKIVADEFTETKKMILMK